ncbi:MAG: DUF2167 domain-containing protein [Clostridia bacterium]|nr:DUF2167 domain-containing protein [Deltaproteobacteria bacterium]
MREITLMHALLALTASTALAAPHKAKMKGNGPSQQQAAETAPADAKAGGEEEDDDGLDNGLPRIDGVDWQRGPTKADLENATVDVPEGFAFTGVAGTRKFLEATGNLPGTSEKGTLWKIPTVQGARTWFVIYDYDDSGHVVDKDKNDLDADATLKSLTKNNEAGNEERKQRQLPPLHIIGWYAPPHYDEQTHNLEWATRLQNEDSQRVSINYEVRLLGRTGVMSATLVGGEQLMDTATPEFKSSLKTFAYKEGDKYGEYKKGDKLAAYGIAGLIGAGGLAVAAKAGLLSKLGVFIAKGAKLIFVGLAAAVGGIAKLFKRKPKEPTVHQ